MTKMNKIVVLLASVALASTAVAGKSKTESDNWRSAHGDLQWKNAYGECWGDAFINKGGKKAPACGAPAPAPAPAAPKPTPVAPAPKPTPKPAPKPVPVKSAQEVLGNTTFGADAFFQFDKAVLKPEARTKLGELASRIQSLVNLDSIVAIGHTDSIGAAAYNQRLSVRRAQSVKNYLVKQGIPAAQIQVQGMGETQPIAPNNTRAGRAQNRRVDIQVNGTARQGTGYVAPAPAATYTAPAATGTSGQACKQYSIDGTCLNF